MTYSVILGVVGIFCGAILGGHVTRSGSKQIMITIGSGGGGAVIGQFIDSNNEQSET